MSVQVDGGRGWTMLPAPVGTQMPYNANPTATTPDGHRSSAILHDKHARIGVLWRGGQSIVIPPLHPGWGAGAGAITSTGDFVLCGGSDPTGNIHVLTIWQEQAARSCSPTTCTRTASISLPGGAFDSVCRKPDTRRWRRPGSNNQIVVTLPLFLSLETLQSPSPGCVRATRRRVPALIL